MHALKSYSSYLKKLIQKLKLSVKSYIERRRKNARSYKNKKQSKRRSNIVIAGILSWILLISFYKILYSNALSQTMLALFAFIGALLLPLAGMTIPFIIFYLSDKCDLQEAQEKAKHQHAKKAPSDIYAKR